MVRLSASKSCSVKFYNKFTPPQNTSMEDWISQNEKIFSDFGLSTPCVQLNELPGYWKIDKQAPATDHPSAAFFSKPILTVERAHSNSVISIPVEVDFFKPEIWKYKVESAVETHEFQDYADQKYSTFTIEFEAVTTPTKFLEPIVAEVFLYDTARKQKITDSWRFLANRDNFDQKVLSLIDDAILNAPKNASFPYVTDLKQNVVVVCFLERLVMKDKCGKYLQKPTDSHISAIKRGLSKCRLEKQLIRFAYGTAPLGTGNQKTVIKNFVVNSPFDLTGEIKEKNRLTGFECVFKHVRSSNVIRIFDDFLPAPYSNTESYLGIRLASFHKSVSEKFFVEITAATNEKVLGVFRSRVCHDEKEQIMDTFFVPLPPGVCVSGSVKIGFLVRTVSSRKEKKKSDLIHTSEMLVAKDGVFMANGDHVADGVCFSTFLRSPFYTSSSGIDKLWHRVLPDDIASLDKSEVIRNFYSVMDVLMKMGTDQAFVWMFQIVGLVDESICDQYCRLMNPESNIVVELLKQWHSSKYNFWSFLHIVLKCILKFKSKNPELDAILLKISEKQYKDEEFALFLRDLFEIYDRTVVLQMLEVYLSKLNLERDPQHRKQFRSILKLFLTPKGFLIANAPKGNTTLLLDILFPCMTRTARVYRHIYDIFHVINDLIVQFDEEQQNILLKNMTLASFSWFSQNRNWIEQYPKIEDRRHVSLFAGMLLRVTTIETDAPVPGFLIACKQYLRYFGPGRMESLFIDVLKRFSGMEVVNCVVSGLMKRSISPELLFAIMDYIQRNTADFFAEQSPLKSLMCSIVTNLDQARLEILSFFLASECMTFDTTIRCISLFTRALQKVEITEDALRYVRGTLYGKVFEDIYNVNQQIKNVSETDDPITYAELLRRKADLLKSSPDARLQTLLQLSEVHIKTKHFAEAVVAQLSCALLVHHRLFGTRFPIDYVKGLEETTEDIKINGYCTSEYFSLFGLSVLLEMAVGTAKRGSMYELINQIHSVLIPLAEEKRLWLSLKQFYLSGSGAWGVINDLATGSDRDFGLYYRVQFEDEGEFIYREIDFANLWTVNEEMKKAAVKYAKGKEIVVQNDGEEIHDKEQGKYYVHVKAVQPYFTPDEKKERGTLFEQNGNITKFHFDIPVSKASQESVENCWLKRYIFELPEPMPGLETRVGLTVANRRSIMYSPIEFCCESLSKKVQLIEAAAKRRNYQALQPLIHGSLLVQVNEGPKKMAEVFLTGGEENEHTAELRRIFREFLKVNETAVQVHSEYTKQNPVYASLQDELELGLARLKSSLQPYLN